MTDVKARDAARFLERLPPAITAVLLYGSDTGLVAERSDRLAKALAADPKRPGDILRLDEDDMADDPDRLVVELRTVSMFGDRKIVRLRGEAKLKPDLAAGLLAPDIPLEGFLIVEAGNLKPDSKLRTAFAQAAAGAAVACFPDDAGTLASLANEVLDASGLAMTREVRQHLIALLGADRALSRNEIEKLALYMGERKEVTIADVDAVVGDAAEQALDLVINAAAGGRIEAALAEFDRSIGAGESVQSVLLALQRHLWRLHQVVAAKEGGKPVESALRTIWPPLHFKQQAAMTEQARLWSADGAAGILALCQTAITDSRLMPLLEREIAERLLMQVAMQGKAGRR